VTSAAQKKAVLNHRKRLRRSGLGRFEVQGRVADKKLLRELARKLAENSADSTRMRQTLADAVSNANEPTGSVWAALRRSPLVGGDVEFERIRAKPRTVNL
jgi:hypothetical protein